MTTARTTLAIRQPRLSLPGRLLLAAALRAHRTSPFHNDEHLQRTQDRSRYDAWRRDALCRQLSDHFDLSRLAGRDVLDFGCGAGDLSLTVAGTCNCRSVVGIDLSRRDIDRARSKLESPDRPSHCNVRFELAGDDKRIELPDSSVDVICCFDVVEHIPHIRDTAAQWHRVLRPGGEIWIWWSPWRGPYGHHVESLIPLPWIHLLFSARSVFAVCAEVYDHESFVPRMWDLDPSTGHKLPNKWRDMKRYSPFLNGLTRRGFESAIRSAGLRIAKRTVYGFSGSTVAKALRVLTPLPILGECFVSYFTYRLIKPD